MSWLYVLSCSHGLIQVYFSYTSFVKWFRPESCARLVENMLID